MLAQGELQLPPPSPPPPQQPVEQLQQQPYQGICLLCLKNIEPNAATEICTTCLAMYHRSEIISWAIATNSPTCPNCHEDMLAWVLNDQQQVVVPGLVPLNPPNDPNGNIAQGLPPAELEYNIDNYDPEIGLGQ